MKALPDSAVCLKCGYLLRGLTEPRCPECGRAFDPRNPSTFRTSTRAHGGIHLDIACLILSLGGLFLLYRYLESSAALCLLAIEIQGLVLGIGTVRMIRPGARKHPVMVVAVVLALYAVVNGLTPPRLQ